MLRVGFEPTTRGFSVRGLCQNWATTAFQYRRQDSNLQPPESESGASCRWATAARRRLGSRGAREQGRRGSPHSLLPRSPAPLLPGSLLLQQRKLKDSNLQGPEALRNSRPAPRTNGVRASDPVCPHTEAAGFEPARPAIAGLPDFKSGAPRQWGQRFRSHAHNAQHDGGSRTRVCGFAGRRLATRPRRGTVVKRLNHEVTKTTKRLSALGSSPRSRVVHEREADSKHDLLLRSRVRSSGDRFVS